MNLPAAARALVAATIRQAAREIDKQLARHDGIAYRGTAQKINTRERYLRMKNR